MCTKEKTRVVLTAGRLCRPRYAVCFLTLTGLATGFLARGGDSSPPLVSFEGASSKEHPVQTDGLGETTVHRAVLMESSSSAVQALTQLAANGADFNAADRFGNAPLHLAALTASPAVIRCLLENGATIDRPGPGGQTALILAVEAGRTPIVEALLKAGADATIKDTAGRTAQALARDAADARIRAAFSGKPAGSSESKADALAALVTGDEPIGAAGYKAALVQLRKLGPEALPPFVAILRDPAKPVSRRRRAAQVLGELHDKGAIPPLMKTLKEENVRLGRAAAEALKKLGPHDQAMDICRHLANARPSDARTRCLLYEALGTAKNPEALPFLIDAQNTETHPDCRVLAARAVDAIIGEKTDGTPGGQIAWIKKNRPAWITYFNQQTQTHSGYRQLMVFFVIGAVLSAGAIWFIWRQVF